MTTTRYICPVCHETAEWRVCWGCSGKGGFDIGTPDEEECPVCDGDGGYWQCPNHHHNAEPVKEPSV